MAGAIWPSIWSEFIQDCWNCGKDDVGQYKLRLSAAYFYSDSLRTIYDPTSRDNCVNFSSLFEWICNDTFTNDLNVCRAILNSLQRIIKRHTENIPWKHLSLCLTILLRNFLSHCEKSEDIRAIETLLSLQRLCGVMAYEVCYFASYFIAKYRISSLLSLCAYSSCIFSKSVHSGMRL